MDGFDSVKPKFFQNINTNECVGMIVLNLCDFKISRQMCVLEILIFNYHVIHMYVIFLII